MMNTNIDDKPLGWRAKIGVISPIENTVSEPEFNSMKPLGVTFHFARMPIHFHPEEDNFLGLTKDLDVRLNELKDCGVNAIAYNCTVGSMACPDNLIIKRLKDVSGVIGVSTAGSIMKALRKLNVSYIALVTPYDNITTKHEKSYFSDRGINVVAAKGMRLTGEGKELGRKFARIGPLDIFNHVLSTNNKKADAILISCANFGSASIIEKLEKKLKKPIISSNTATFWAILRAGNIKDRITGFGCLLSEY